MLSEIGRTFGKKNDSSTDLTVMTSIHQSLPGGFIFSRPGANAGFGTIWNHIAFERQCVVGSPLANLRKVPDQVLRCAYNPEFPAGNHSARTAPEGGDCVWGLWFARWWASLRWRKAQHLQIVKSETDEWLISSCKRGKRHGMALATLARCDQPFISLTLHRRQRLPASTARIKKQIQKQHGMDQAKTMGHVLGDCSTTIFCA